jgi:uncharacterized protein involved in exopolysaccharide biosynthesis
MTEQYAPRESSGFMAGLVPIVDGWRTVVTWALLGGLIAIGVILYRGPRYKAELSLVSVGSSKIGNIGAGSLAAAASLLGGASGGIGLQSSPALVVKFADLDGVLASVALSPVGPGSRQLVVERLADKPLSQIPSNRLQRIMRKYLSASYDRTTGIIDIDVVHKDSAIARIVATRIVDETRTTFLHAVRGQATELRKAQEQRVAVAEQEMSSAEDKMQSFLGGNRAIAAYSAASVEKDRLQREVSRAQDVLTQAVTDRESARSKELEDTPAVVVIDPLPASLPQTERHLGAIALVSAFVAAILAMLLLLAKESFVRRIEASDPATVRLASSLRAMPLIGRRVPAAPAEPARGPYPAPEPVPATPFTRTGTGTRG